MPAEIEAPETLDTPPQPNNRQEPPSMKGWMAGLPALEPETPPAQPGAEAAPEPPESAAKPAEAPSKPAEKPAEPAEEKWPRSAKDWDAFRSARKAEKETLAAEAKAAREERDRIKAELEEARKAPTAPADYEELKKRNEEADRILKTVAVERNPRFVSYFKGKFDQQYGMAKAIVGSEHAGQIEKILKINDPEVRDQKFEDFTSTLTTMQQSRLAAVLNNVTAIEQEKADALAHAEQSYNEMDKAEKARIQSETTARQQAYTKAFDTEIAAAQDSTKGLPIFQKKEGDADWNKQVDSLVEQSRTILTSGNKMAPADAARAAMYAASFPGLLQWANTQITAKDTEIARLTEQVKKLTGAEPSFRGGEKPAGGGNETPARIQQKAHSTPADATAGWVSQITQDWRK